MGDGITQQMRDAFDALNYDESGEEDFVGRAEPYTREELADYDGSVIYLITCREYVKIGITTNVFRRLVALQTCNPYFLKLIAMFPGGLSVERAIHGHFNRYRIHGEWFEWSAEISLWVKSGCPLEKIINVRRKSQAMVGLDGIEPSTSRMSSERSTPELQSHDGSLEPALFETTV